MQPSRRRKEGRGRPKPEKAHQARRFAPVVSPRIVNLPKKGDDRLGKETLELCAKAGLVLDEWQAYVLVESMRSTDAKWAYFEAALNVPRQNGKGGIIEARLIGEAYVVKSSLSIYSAHNFDTSLEHFRRLQMLIEESPVLSKELIGEKGGRKYGVTFGHGKEGFEFTGDRRIRFRTRTKGGGRGFSCDCLILDEAMFIPEFTHGALLPTLSARENPQVWYTGSAVDQNVHEDGVVFARARERGIAGDSELAYFEWSAGNGEPEKDHPDTVDPRTLRDIAAWSQANPALGKRITTDYIESVERRSMDARTFAVERLGIGDWPRTDHTAANPIDWDEWLELEDESSVLKDPIVVAFDSSPDRRSSISCAGKNQRGQYHVETALSKPGTGWVVEALQKIKAEAKVDRFVCDGYGPAANLVPALNEAGIEVDELSSTEHARACADLVDGVEGRTFRHRGGSDLNPAVHQAKTRPLGDAWAWSRKNSAANISPLVSATLALSAAMTAEPKRRVATAWA